MREHIEERGFSGVRVADERNHPKRDGLACAAARGALSPDGFNGFLDLADTIADTAAIGFEFLFARAACANAAAKAREFFAASGEAREQVIQLRQLDLKLAFTRAGVRGKNVENELRAVNHAAADSLLHIAKLNGREIVVHDYERDAMEFGFHADFVDLTAPDESGRIERLANLQQGASYVCASADRKLLQFFQRIAARSRRIACTAARRFFQANADQKDALSIVNGLRGFHLVGDGRLGLNLAGINLFCGAIIRGCEGRQQDRS